MFDSVVPRLRGIAPAVEFWSLRVVDQRYEGLTVRQNIVERTLSHRDIGVMVSVIDQGGLGYAATSDLSSAGIQSAFSRARHWAMAKA